MIRYCGACGASLTADALYCGECGALDRRALRDRARAEKADDRAIRRRAQAIGIVVVGVFAGLVIGVIAFPESLLAAAATTFVLDLVIASVALAWIGGRAVRHAIGRRPGMRDLLLAIPTTVVTFAAASAYVVVLDALLGLDADLPAEPLPVTPTIWLLAVVFAPIAEEWLCRGALWTAVRPVTTRNTAIVATAIVFGFMHGLNGFLILEVPHRFAIGLALGWLRATTGSLLPCVLAHALHNTAALLLE